MVESALRADSTLYPTKIFLGGIPLCVGEFQRIWGVSSPTHILLATQDVPLFSVLKLSINSRSHTVFFQKATRLETVRAGLVHTAVVETRH